jgi:hypothetical protein
MLAGGFTQQVHFFKPLFDNRPTGINDASQFFKALLPVLENGWFMGALLLETYVMIRTLQTVLLGKHDADQNQYAIKVSDLAAE